MTGRLFLRLILAALSILVVAVLAVELLASRVAERTYIDGLTRDLTARGKMLEAVLDGGFRGESEESWRRMARALGGRLTLIARDGTVVRDSEADAARMENHAHRPEILEALAGRGGAALRPSPTLGVPFLYVAVPVKAGALRLAVPVAEVRTGSDAIRGQLLAAVGIALIPAMILAALIARYVSARLGAIIDYAGKLADGQFEARLKKTGTDELGILERKLNDTGEKLQHTVEQLRKEQAELEKLERVRKDFVINVSHELRTPLASIQGYTETLLEGAVHDDANNLKFLSIIRQNAERLGRLTSDLLTLSRIELKTQQFRFASYYVHQLIHESVDAMRPIADKKGIVLRAEAPEAAAEVFCDAEAVHQILSNLLDNAIKYTPAGGSIVIGGGPAEGARDYVEIYVKDTGIGIPEEDLPRLFERFYRVDKARSRELGGTGLGLAIVKHLAKAMGGEVRVSSRPREGSTFAFSLPVHDLGLPEEISLQGQLTVL
ncbi:MAG: HAMP domain-containing protein [Bryobacterales bacterium]|nr:HAMP domain-containing protein [Bryobacterales bacterium]